MAVSIVQMVKGWLKTLRGSTLVLKMDEELVPYEFKEKVPRANLHG